MCGAPPNLILEGLVIQPEGADAERSTCRCAFREGNLVCVTEEGIGNKCMYKSTY